MYYTMHMCVLVHVCQVVGQLGENCTFATFIFTKQTLFSYDIFIAPNMLAQQALILFIDT